MKELSARSKKDTPFSSYIVNLSLSVGAADVRRRILSAAGQCVMLLREPLYVGTVFQLI